MSEPTYTLILTESERTAFAKVLGGLVTKLINAPIFVEAPSGGTAAARAVLSPPQTPAAVAPTAPVLEQRDRWARDRKGNELPPREYTTVEARISTAERANLSDGTPRMKVSWPAQTKGFVNANCFDDRLFPFLALGSKSGAKTTLYIVQSGKYTNIAGVRA